jgi:hypothetical protein
MDVIADIGEQGRIAQLLQPKIVDEEREGELALIQRSSPDGKDAAGAANPANARVMSRRSAYADRSGCDQRRGQSRYNLHCFAPLAALARSAQRALWMRFKVSGTCRLVPSDGSKIDFSVESGLRPA